MAWQSAPIGPHRGTDAARDARGPRVTWLRQSPDLESRVECKQTKCAATLQYEQEVLFGTWSAVALGGRSVRVHGVASEGR